MINWLTITLALAAALLLAIALRLRHITRTQDSLIRALQYSVRLSKENAAIHEHRAATLERAFVQQQERIGWLVAQNGELEDRNACLERIHRKAGLAYVLGLPEVDGPKVLAAKGRITLN